METWRDRAKSRMKEIGKTQDWLSEQFEMTPAGMQKWLAGSRQPSLEDINRIADALDCPRAWLTHGLDPQDSTDGLPEPGRSTLRRLIGAQRAGPLPQSLWTAVEAVLNTVLPTTTAPPAATAQTGGSPTPTSHAAPRNGTHG